MADNATTGKLEYAKLIVDYVYINTILSAVADPMDLNLECQFNPAQISIDKTVQYVTMPNPLRDFPETQYLGGNCAVWSMELYFDAYARMTHEKVDGKRHDIRKDVNLLMAMSLRCNGYSLPLPMSLLGVPPTVIFVWGELKLFRAIMESCSVAYTAFDKSGIPVRAKATVKFKEQSHPFDFLPPQNPSSRTESRNTIRVTQGDRLDLIASDYYGDSRMWRAIADNNDLDDPFNLEPGQLLTMPNIY